MRMNVCIMANKTIYFRDDALWSKAKTMAGKEGLSAVIQKAVERFVAEGERKKEGLQRFTLSVMLPYEEDPEQIAPGDRIAFDGQLLFNMGGVAVDDGSSASHDIECYRTRAGKLIFTTTGSGNDVGEITYYRVYDSVADMKTDSELGRLGPTIRGRFLTEVSNQLGQDWARWID